MGSPVLPAVKIEGLPFARIRLSECLDFISAEIAARRGGWVITPNLDILRRWVQDPGFRQVASKATLFLADGMPIVWVSMIMATPLPERVAGSDLFVSLCGRLAFDGRSAFFLGGSPGAAEGAANHFKAIFPKLKICEPYCPPFGFERDDEEFQKIKTSILNFRPDVVFVGLGCPKQEFLIDKLRVHFPEIWFLGIGVSFSFVAGDVKRAPLIIQRVGLEWLHRVYQEPRRLASRYFIDGIPFAMQLFAGAVIKRFAVYTRDKL